MKTLKEKLALENFIFGFFSTSIQVVLLRLFIVIFPNNEFYFALTLSVYFIFISLGLYSANLLLKRINTTSYYVLILIMILLSVLLPVNIYFLIPVYNNFGIVSQQFLEIKTILKILFVFLLPVCLLIGATFPIRVKIYSENLKKDSITGFFYYYDSLGGGFGALVYFLLTLNSVNFITNILLLTISLSICSFILLSCIKKNMISKILLSIITMLLISQNYLLINSNNVYKYLKEVQWKGFTYQESFISKDGYFELVNYHNEKNIYLNGDLVNSSLANMSDMKLFKLVELIDNKPLTSLVIGGDLNTIAKSLSVKKIDYLNDNEDLVRLLKQRYKNEKKINIIISDEIRFLKETNKKYDLIILNLGESNSLYDNRFYSVENFQLLSEKITPTGYILFSINTASPAIFNTMLEYQNTLYQTLNVIFSNILILNGDSVYFIATNNENITYNNIKEKLQYHKSISARYLDNIYDSEKYAGLIKNYSQNKRINKNFSPKAYYYYLMQNLERFDKVLYKLIKNVNFFFFIIICFFIFYYTSIVKLKKLKSDIIHKVSILYSGILNITLSMIIILIYQINNGTLFYIIGIMFPVYLSGFSFGSFICLKKIINQNLLKSGIIRLFFINIIIIVLIMLIKNVLVNKYLLVLINFVLGIIQGVLSISLVERYSKTGSLNKRLSESYLLDILGGGVGLLLIIPLGIGFFGLVPIITALLLIQVIILYLYLSKT